MPEIISPKVHLIKLIQDSYFNYIKGLIINISWVDTYPVCAIKLYFKFTNPFVSWGDARSAEL